MVKITKEIPVLRKLVIGSITNQVAFYDRALSFVIQSNLGQGAAFTFRTTPKPNGSITLDSVSGLFSYTPTADSIAQFTCTFIAKKEGKIEEQTIRITPLPEGHSDFDIITNTAVAPDPSSTTYMHITDRALSTQKKLFNAGSEKSEKIITREVIISGVDLIFEVGNADNTLYESFHPRKDIEQFKLYADQVIIKSPLCLSSSHVTIYARKLIFEGKGSINTTPSPYTSQSDDLIALDGANGGDIKLFVKNIVGEGKGIRFITTGGIGQKASAGIAGEKGNSVKKWDGKYNREMNWFDPEIDLNFSKKIKGLNGHSVIFAKIIKMWLTSGSSGGKYIHEIEKREKYKDISSWGNSKKWPSNGKDPVKMPGTPGEGGVGGNVHLPKQAKLTSKHFSLFGGKAGEKENDIPASDAGTPIKSCHVHAYFKSSAGIQNKVERIDSIAEKITKKGARGIAPFAKKPKGEAGILKNIDVSKPGYWINPIAAKAFIEYAKDVYLAEQQDLIREPLDEYRQALSDLSSGNHSQILYSSLQVEVAGMIRRIDGLYDYFGNPAGWVPMLSFEANLKLYKNEIETSARLLFLSYWIEKNQENADQLVHGLKVALVSLNEETTAAIGDHKAATKALIDLDLESRNLSVDIDDLLNELGIIEAGLREKAKGDLQMEHIIRSSAKLLGGVLQMIPAGQPALGAIGTGISVLADLDPEAPFDTIKDFGSELWSSKLVQEKLLPKAKNSATAFLKLETDKKVDLTDFDKLKAKKELEAKVKKAIEGEKEVKDQVTSAISNFTVSDDELAEATQRAVADSPEYAEVADKISALGDIKNDFAKTMYSIMQVLDISTDTILNNELGKIEVRYHLSKALKGLNHEARRYANEVGRRARARLIKYQYYLVKSYNYLMLEPRLAVDFGDSYMLKAFSDLLSSSEDGTLTEQQYKSVKSLFEDQLNDIISDIVDAFSSRFRPDSISVGVSLSQRQLSILNQGDGAGKLTINLMEMGYLPTTDDDVRILGIETSEAELVKPPAGKAVNVKLEYLHSGVSVLRNNGRQYLFRTGDYTLPSGNKNALSPEFRNNKMKWGSVIKHSIKGVQTIDDIRPSPSSESLMNYLLKQGEGSQEVNNSIQYYSPSAWSDILIRRTSIPDSYAGHLKNLSFNVIYDFNPAGDDIRTINVISPGGAKPLIQCDKEDLNHRSHGIGSFLRTFNSKSVRKISLTAPPFFGNMTFKGWLMVSGGNNVTSEEESLPLTPLMTKDGIETFLDINDRFSTSERGQDFNRWMSRLKKENTLSLELNRNYSVMAIYLTVVS